MIDIFFMFLKKSLVTIVFVLFGFATVYVPLPSNGGGYVNVEEAEAGGVVLDPVNLVQNTITAVQAAASYVVNSWMYLKENVLDGIAWMIAKQLISNLISDVVNWINSGFAGSPAFVQDLDNFLLRAADEAVGEYINSLGGVGSFVCAPFRLDVQLAVALQYDLSRENRVPECTLTSVITSFEDFISGDFDSGGWAGWFDLVGQPRSTPYGSILTAQTEAAARVVNARGEELKLLDFGDGFLSYKHCEPVGGPSGTDEICSVVTPGQTIADSLNKALGATQDTLVEADEFNEIVTALVGQLTSRAITGARGLLGSGSTYTPYSRSSFVSDLADGTIDDSGTGGTTGTGVVGVGSTGSDAGLDLIRSSILAQDTILLSVTGYITDLQNFISNPRNASSDIITARILLTEARNIRTRVTDGRADALPILTAYEALESEYVTAAPERRTEIRNLQATLIQEFSNLSLMREQEYDVYTSRWDQLLARDVPPPPPPPVIIIP